jgi:hypothetical protein
VKLECVIFSVIVISDIQSVVLGNHVTAFKWMTGSIVAN